MSVLQDVLALAVVLSVVVFVHEFGHFAVAKAFRFPVEVFSLGFGKRVFGWTWRGTDYRVSMLPLGGYVRVAGLGPDESTTVGVVSEAEGAPLGPRWQRGLILLAGPVMNFVLAVLLQAAALVVGLRVAKYLLDPPVVQSIVPDSPGARAGFQKGDRIVSIGGDRVATWQDAEFDFAVSPRQRLAVEIERGGARRTLFVTPEGVTKFDIGKTGVGPALRPRVAQVFPHGPAAAAGFREGDIVVSVDGHSMDSVGDLIDAVSRYAPGPETVEVERAGARVVLTVSPRREAGGWKMGVALVPDVPTVVEKFGPVPALRQGWRQLRSDTHATLGVIAKLFVGRASVKQMSGPIAIGQFAGEAAREGAVPFVALMGALSLQLGILNLLPVPMLDGGQIAIVLVEGTIRRDLSVRVKERILQLGFLLLVLLMGVVIYNDILKIF